MAAPVQLSLGTRLSDAELPERIAQKIREERSGCWIWAAATSTGGYGRFTTVTAEGQPFQAQAHRLVYELLRGPISEGLTLDHLCRNRRCVNPAHLEAITHRENCVRGEGLAARALATHCARGHAFDAQNTLIKSDGRRRCRECRNSQRRKGA